MKKILGLLLIGLMLGTEVNAADFTISVQSPAPKLEVFRKSDRTKLGEFVQLGTLYTYKTDSGKYISTGLSTIYFDQSDCSGNAFIGGGMYVKGMYIQNFDKYYQVLDNAPATNSSYSSNRAGSTGNCVNNASSQNMLPLQPYLGTDLPDVRGTSYPSTTTLDIELK